MVRRLTPSGATDYTFGAGDGEVTISAQARASDVIVEPDGHIVVTGQAYDANGSDELRVRYTAAGIVDASVGPAGGGSTRLMGGPQEDDLTR